jgi:hypothetical protein
MILQFDTFFSCRYFYTHSSRGRWFFSRRWLFQLTKFRDFWDVYIRLYRSSADDTFTDSWCSFSYRYFYTQFDIVWAVDTLTHRSTHFFAVDALQLSILIRHSSILFQLLILYTQFVSLSAVDEFSAVDTFTAVDEFSTVDIFTAVNTFTAVYSCYVSGRCFFSCR